MYRLEWRPLAENDLAGIVEYIGQDNPERAESFAAELRAKAELLRENPKMYRKSRFRGIHELVAHPNYIILYRIIGQTVEVLRIKHTSQNWP
jgi:addiction module RelE/StbE family toxin